MKCGYWQYKLNGLTDLVVYEKPQTTLDHVKIFIKNNGLVSIGWQVAMWGVLYSMGHGLYFLLWVLAYLIPFPLFLRVR